MILKTTFGPYIGCDGTRQVYVSKYFLGYRLSTKKCRNLDYSGYAEIVGEGAAIAQLAVAEINWCAPLKFDISDDDMERAFNRVWSIYLAPCIGDMEFHVYKNHVIDMLDKILDRENRINYCNWLDFDQLAEIQRDSGTNKMLVSLILIYLKTTKGDI